MAVLSFRSSWALEKLDGHSFRFSPASTEWKVRTCLLGRSRDPWSFCMSVTRRRSTTSWTLPSGTSYDEAVSFDEGIAYLPSVKYFPGAIGGHCVIPNVSLLKRTFDSQLLDAIQWSDNIRRGRESPKFGDSPSPAAMT